MNRPYDHHESIHSIDACTELVSVLHKLIRPESVVDVGCGTGNFLKAFTELGVTRVLGYDGAWVDSQQRRQFLKDEDFRVRDLESLSNPVDNNTEAMFDLAICLEVAEHLHPSAADGLVSFLASQSDTIVFSAAVPHQPGQNHIHCQWPEYWGERFRNLGYTTFDQLRMSIWDIEAIPWWYRQNIFIACRERAPLYESLTSRVSALPALVHPKLLEYHLEHLEIILRGEYPLKGYASMLRKKLQSYFQR